VEDLEEHFGVHAYSEATMIVKPSILISLQVSKTLFGTVMVINTLETHF
jgi:hypothetical protein